MNEVLQTPEKSTPLEIDLPNSSLGEFQGDLNDLPSPAFDSAVIAAQESMGPAYHLSESTFGDIMNDAHAGDWQNMPVGKALAAFDRAYGRYVMRMNKVPEEQIMTIQGHDDYTTDTNSPDAPQQINGINIPAEVTDSEEIDPNLWAAEEAKRREDYIFKQAEFHLGYQFEINGVLYYVDGIYYTGTDGNYSTLAIDIKKVNPENGDDGFEQEISLAEVENRIKTGEAPLDETENDEAEDNSEAKQRFERSKDDPDTLPRAALELFVRQHKDETDQPADPPAQDSDSDKSDTIEALDTEYQTKLKDTDLDEERQKAIDEFNSKIGDQEIFDQFIVDLDSYLDSQRSLQQQIREREENARQDAYDLAA